MILDRAHRIALERFRSTPREPRRSRTIAFALPCGRRPATALATVRRWPGRRSVRSLLATDRPGLAERLLSRAISGVQSVGWGNYSELDHEPGA